MHSISTSGEGFSSATDEAAENDAPENENVEPLEAPGPFSDPVKAYHLAIITAHFEGKWARCFLAKCLKRKRCCGGPRGHYSRYGKPYCQVFGIKPEEMPYGSLGGNDGEGIDDWRGEKGDDTSWR